MKKKVLMELQFFADGDGAGAGTGTVTGDSDSNGGGAKGQGTGSNDDGDDGNKSPSFDDFLKDTKNQAEFDRRLNQSIEKAVTKAEEKWKVLTDTKLSEAEKLAKMSADEKAAYEAKKREDEFNARVAAFEKEKLLVVIKEDLQKQSLPIVFAESLVTVGEGDAETIKVAIADLKKTWDAEIAEAIKAKARQKTPTESGQAGAGNAGDLDIGEMARNARIIK